MNNLTELFCKSDNRKKPSELVERKWESAFDVDEWEVETDKGFSSISKIGKTVPYEVWEIETITGKKLKCADTHIVFNEIYKEVFVKDLNKDTRPDKIITIDGPEIVIRVQNLGYIENMYDIQVEHEDHRFWTDEILSHNSIWLANDAVNYVKAGFDVAVITAEMAEIDFIHRIGANLLGVKISEYEKLSKQGDFIKNRLNNLKNGVIPPGNLFVKEYPTSQATVPEIESYLKELESTQGLKLKVIIIDYINILSNYRNPNTENTYMKIKQIAEDLRAMAVRNEWIIISATQINRCLTLDTLVNHETKGKIELRDIIVGDRILSNEGYTEVKKVWPVHKQRILKIKTKSGKEIRCSWNHRFPVLINDESAGLVEAGFLIKGQKILVSQNI